MNHQIFILSIVLCMYEFGRYFAGIFYFIATIVYLWWRFNLPIISLQYRLALATIYRSIKNVNVNVRMCIDPFAHITEWTIVCSSIHVKWTRSIVMCKKVCDFFIAIARVPTSICRNKFSQFLEYRVTRKHLCKDYDEYVNAAWIIDSQSLLNEKNHNIFWINDNF